MSASSSPPERAFVSLFLLWAKIPPGDAESFAYHPPLCHMVDSAAPAALVWERALSEQDHGFVIVEAVMGKGKAEAALLILQSGRQSGAAWFLQLAASTRKA
jgi:hypothetical protein